MNHYEILGISPAATDSEIRQAYLNRVAELEYGEMDAGTKDRQTAELKKAFDTLGNQTSRDIYYNLLRKEQTRVKKSGLELEASKGFGVTWFLVTVLGYVFLAVASLLVYLVVASLSKGTAFWIQSDPPYLITVSRLSDPVNFWVSFSVLSLLGLIFARIAFGILRSVFRRLSMDD